MPWIEHPYTDGCSSVFGGIFRSSRRQRRGREVCRIAASHQLPGGVAASWRSDAVSSSPRRISPGFCVWTGVCPENSNGAEELFEMLRGGTWQDGQKSAISCISTSWSSNVNVEAFSVSSSLFRLISLQPHPHPAPPPNHQFLILSFFNSIYGWAEVHNRLLLGRRFLTHVFRLCVFLFSVGCDSIMQPLGGWGLDGGGWLEASCFSWWWFQMFFIFTDLKPPTR